MIKRYRLNKIIEKSVLEAAEAFEDRVPAIAEHLFYGAFEIDPQNLVIWYLFRTNDELAEAEKSGLCDEITERTKELLIKNHYPIASGTKKEQSRTLDMFSHTRISISFTTQQDIKEKANGNYYWYFK